jgi:group II intron reverse transcriptase/maturase
MLKAVDYLNIVRDRGRRRLPLEDVYRQLFNPELYLTAYGKIAANRGALTKGSTPETVDGMSLGKIQAIIDKLRTEQYRWTPVRRVYVEKRNSTKKRPLGIPTWSDKLLQEVIRLILEAYYEPQFSPTSHGFRANRGCGTALMEIKRTWKGTAWFIEGDIAACFDSIDHRKMLSILGENIHDNRFLRLIANLLGAGYLEQWKYNATLSGTPQGGIVSPILSNIYLDRLDAFVENILIPAYSRGDHRRANPAYSRVERSLKEARRAHRMDVAEALSKELHTLPSKDTRDPNYRRLRYLRYADDFLLGFAGPRHEADEIKHRIRTFLREELSLELSEPKTLITHGRTEYARFLGYELSVLHSDTYRDDQGTRSVNGVIGLKVPHSVLVEKRKAYMHNGTTIHRTELINDTVFSIVAKYESEFAGLVNYYRLAYNLTSLSYLRYTMEVSLTKTLAAKLQISVPQVYRQYHGTHEGRKVLQVTVAREGKPPLVATFGRVSLKWESKAVLDDSPQPVWFKRTELVERLLAQECELCGSHDNINVHHVRALKDINRPGQSPKPLWSKVMSARRRKTLVVCHNCHVAIHNGQPQPQSHTPRATGEPDAVKAARPVRRGADGKVPAAT